VQLGDIDDEEDEGVKPAAAGGENFDGSADDEGIDDEEDVTGNVGIILNSAAMRDSRLSDEVLVETPIFDKVGARVVRGVVGGDSEAPICVDDADATDEVVAACIIAGMPGMRDGGGCGDEVN
jgi:hypothetical protein